MRIASLILATLVGTCLAQTEVSPRESADSGISQKEIALDNLLSERRSVAALEKVIEDARKSGISDQAILEARFLYHVDRHEDAAIAAMLPDFIKQRDRFKLVDSAIFSVKEDWLAVIEYVQAIDSLTKGDKPGFKTHITEAFWLSPRQASAFGPHIERLRLVESMRSVKIDFESRFASLAKGDAASLKSLMKGKKAMILHFWSPASRECEASIPDYVITAKVLGEKGIAMVSILPDNTPTALTDARKMILPLGIDPPGAWLTDETDGPLAHELRIQTLPTFVLVSNAGKVLFNGEPDDDGLWEALRKIDPSIIRPDMIEDGGR
jgi:hypothetical protein